jgi:glycogen debranching enzyme
MAKRNSGSNAPECQARFPLAASFALVFLVAAWGLRFEAPGGAAETLEASRPLEISRPVRPWEFSSSVGKHAGIFGNESGRLEAWVYPLKIFRQFHLNFRVAGAVLPAESLARTITVRPESTSILYAGDTFRVRETFFTPVDEPGALVLFDIETEQPIEIEAAFIRDFQLEWPAAMGGTYSDWDPRQHAFAMGEERKKFAALVGSPTAEEVVEEYMTNYSESQENVFRLGVSAKGHDTKVIAIAGSVQGVAAAAETYRHLCADSADLLRQSSDYYRNYLSQTLELELPDAQLQQAYDWARVSMVQGMVTNPYLGTGLVAGYRTSGDGQRPGFAWFFGRDSLWTDLALNAAGDFADTHTALEFISKYQRDDGKMPHEIPQGAEFVPWFKEYPYAYASVDSTPLYIIAVNDYVVRSGDIAFVKEKWDGLLKAYDFLRSTYDADGLAQNLDFGTGWVEGGPLYPVKSEIYQAGLAVEALRALSNLAHRVGKDDMARDLTQKFERQRQMVNDTFWVADTKRYAFALDKNGKTMDDPSVLTTVPMWFGLLDQNKASAMISQLAELEHQTDWGMRIISNQSPIYSGGGYHYGSVWPLFTGWASVGEYRYHRAFPAYSNLRANALLALNGSPGHVTEVLSGDYFQGLSTGSPHQIWSSAMIVSPILRGMLGLESDAAQHTLKFAPHVPADWTSFAARHVTVGSESLDLAYGKTVDAITLQVHRTGGGDSTVDFEPAVSLRARVIGAEWSGRPIHFDVSANDQDQHVIVHLKLGSTDSTLRIRIRGDFGVDCTSQLPPLGSASQGLRILSESWSPSRDAWTLQVSGMPGAQYDLGVWNASQVASVEGAQMLKADGGQETLRIHFPDAPANAADATARSALTFHFIAR